MAAVPSILCAQTSAEVIVVNVQPSTMVLLTQPEVAVSCQPLVESRQRQLAPSRKATSSRTSKGNKTYSCEFDGCNRTFQYPTHLRYHLMTHTGTRYYSCKVCSSSFYTAQRLKVHMRCHNGERPFTCPDPTCDRAFTTAGNLKNHLRLHTGERPFVCAICGATFVERSTWRKHQLHHTGEKPYSCPRCNASFSQSSSRNKHVRRCDVTRDVTEEVEIDSQVDMGHVQVLSVCPSRQLVTVGTQAGEGDLEQAVFIDGAQDHGYEEEDTEARENEYELGEKSVETETREDRCETSDVYNQDCMRCPGPWIRRDGERKC